MSSGDTYDIVIVGGGLGGLLSAVILAKEGKNVCVLEQDKQVGGCLQTFSIDKKVFDSCVHYIGGLGDGHTLNKIFSYVGIMDKLSLKSYDTNAFDKVCFGDEDIEYPQAQGKDNFIEQLLPYFPNERKALEEYIKLISKVGDHFPLYRLRNGDSSEKDAVTNWELSETLNKLTQNKKLQNVLIGNNLLYSGVKGKTPFYLHALVLESYIHSSHKVHPGSSQISKFLWQELQQYGGVVHRNTTVTKLFEENGQLQYVETADGERIYGKQFIANIHPKTLLKILDSKLIKPAYRKRINSIQQTTSSYMLNLVLRPRAVKMCHHNLYWNAGTDALDAVNYTTDTWPTNYALFYNEDKNNEGFAESLSILTYMDYDEVISWEHITNRTGHERERGESYARFKTIKNENLLNKVYERVPELKGNFTNWKAATPLTYRDYTNTPEGALYGNLKDVSRPAETTIPTRTKIPNLLLTGQNINMHGVLGVSITAIATCAELLGMEYILHKINKQ